MEYLVGLEETLLVNETRVDKFLDSFLNGKMKEIAKKHITTECKRKTESGENLFNVGEMYLSLSNLFIDLSDCFIWTRFFNDMLKDEKEEQ